MVDTVFYNHSGAKSIKEIVEITKAELVSVDKEKEMIENVCSIESAGANDLCFFYDKKSKDKAQMIKAKACITIKELQHLVPENVILAWDGMEIDL